MVVHKELNTAHITKSERRNRKLWWLSALKRSHCDGFLLHIQEFSKKFLHVSFHQFGNVESWISLGSYCLRKLLGSLWDCWSLPWFFGGVHLTDEVLDPQDESADHGEEPEEVTGVSQFLATSFTEGLQLEPGVDHFGLTTSDLAGLIAGVGCLQPGRIFLDALNLTMQRLKILKVIIKQKFIPHWIVKIQTKNPEMLPPPEILRYSLSMDLQILRMYYLVEVLVFALKSRDGSGIAAELVRQCVLFLDDATENILAVVEELVKFPRSCQHLSSCFDQLEQVRLNSFHQNCD